MTQKSELPIDQVQLAVDRTLLAYDRTLMAWIRTSVSLISFGFTVYKFFQFLGDQGFASFKSRVFGPREFSILLICLGNFALILATIQYVLARRVIRKTYHLKQTSFVAVFSFMTAMFGVLLLVVTLMQA